ncbi:MAG: RnfH family protein [Methyloglobulus sp.]|nr:RnfH family protein [Methyloglobulus sp.]
MADVGSSEEGFIGLEVAYAKPEEQVIVTIKVQQGTTIAQAAELSGLLARFPEISDSELKVGVFGVLCKPYKLVNQGDRIEIYRPLVHDPKEARRQRALKN